MAKKLLKYSKTNFLKLKIETIRQLTYKETFSTVSIRFFSNTA